MGRREIAVVCLVCILVVLTGGCAGIGIPADWSPAGESDSGSVSSPPPSGDTGQTADDSDSSSTPSEDAGQGTDGSQPASSSGAPEVIASAFAGCWDSPEWGWMRLEANGTAVSGAYEYDEGRIEGVVDGFVFTGMWLETPSYAPPDDGGEFEFVLSADGQSFAGQWRYGSGEGWSGSWTAVRVECEPAAPSGPALQWANRWDTTYGEMVLSFSGDRVTGEYESDDGRIEGTVSGRLMTGIWAEEPSYAPPNDAGQFEFTLAEDGRSFTGRWRYGSEGSWRLWSGTLAD